MSSWGTKRILAEKRRRIRAAADLILLRAITLLHCLRHPLGGDVLAEVGRDRSETALVLEEVGLLRERFRRGAVGTAAEPGRRRLILQAREAVERHRVRNLFRLAARPLRDGVDLRLVARPGL